MNRLLYSLLYFIEEATDYDFQINTELPVQQQLCDKFDKFSYRSTVASFLLHHGIALNDNFFNLRLSLRQLSEYLEFSERVDDDSFTDLVNCIARFIMKNEEERYAAMEKRNSLTACCFLH